MDHKTIGKQFLITGIVWAIIGGLFSVLFRLQAVQQQRLQDANQYGMELSLLMQQYEQQGATKQATAEFRASMKPTIL